MSVWIPVAVALALSAAWLARPLLARGRIEVGDCEQAISIFHDQRDELERDAALGLVGAAERAEAEREIGRRSARAARAAGDGIAVSRPSLALVLVTVAFTAAVSLGLYLRVGSPGLADQPLQARLAGVQRALDQAHDPAAGRGQAAAVPGEDTFESWWLRARAHAAAGDHASAAHAYKRAAELSADRPAVVSAYAEALTLANGNKVPAAELAPRKPAARGPTAQQVAAAGELSEAGRERMVQAMVDRLAARLRGEPQDLDGWLMLIRSYAVMQDRERAEGAVREALGVFGSGAQRTQVLRAAAELGLVPE